MRASSDEPHAGHVSPSASTCPQWWQRSDVSPCSVSATSQFGTAPRRAARAAVDRRRHPAPVQQQDRLAAALRDPAELLEERRRQRIPRLAAQVDDLHRRHRRRDAAAELEPLEPLPRLRPRRRGAEDRDRAFERRALRRDGARVVARIGLLLVRRVVLLVDADDAERRHRREHRRARTDDDRSLARRDPLALVAPLRLGQRGVQHGDAIAEAHAEAAERLRRERDLRHEHDRAAAARERRLAGADVDLGLAAAGRAEQQDVAAVAVEQLVDARERALLRLGQMLRRRLRRERADRRSVAPLAAALRVVRRDERERTRRRRAVVVGEPEREIDERRRQRLRDALDRRRRNALRQRRRPISVTTPRRRALPNFTSTTAPFSPPSGTSYVNGRATARAVTRG